MARALVFDFDGLVLDTETAVFSAWERVYAEHGAELPRERWLASIGTDGSPFEPLAHLRSVVRAPIDEAELQASRRAHRDRVLLAMLTLPGVEEWILAARRLGLGLAIASSSPYDWVAGHLERLGLIGHFDVLMTLERVREAKPSPELFLGAAAELGVAPAEAVALEDSPNGVRSATRAGLYCVAVPGPMTRGLDFGEADLVLDSLAERSLDEVLERRRRPGA